MCPLWLAAASPINATLPSTLRISCRAAQELSEKAQQTLKKGMERIRRNLAKVGGASVQGLKSFLGNARAHAKACNVCTCMHATHKYANTHAHSHTHLRMRTHMPAPAFLNIP